MLVGLSSFDDVFTDPRVSVRRKPMGIQTSLADLKPTDLRVR